MCGCLVEAGRGLRVGSGVAGAAGRGGTRRDVVVPLAGATLRRTLAQHMNVGSKVTA